MKDLRTYKIHAVPTNGEVVYPESDGKPMAETDIHRNLMIDVIQMLNDYFRSRPDVYVSGNLLLYYQKGNPRKSVAPDVFVVIGVPKQLRRTYLLWEEGKGPDFVLELSSEHTYRQDLRRKKQLYAKTLGVKEYYLYDPEHRYLHPPLQGYRLVNGTYVPILSVEGRLPSEILGLELGLKSGTLGLYHPQHGAWLLRPVEQAEAWRGAEARAQQAEARANQAEAELERLRAKLKAAGILP
ncbi:Uma2 family endonuclease [Candidatus Poribacteria bacterium]|nr:Uma2 family endonuclease [Candidatus Poribacteria bacterium]